MTIFEYLNKLLLDRENCTILELGAHQLLDTPNIISAIQPYGKFRVICVDADIRNIAAIKLNNPPILKYVELVHCAIGEKSGKTKLFQSSGNVDPSKESWTGSSSISRPTLHLEAHPWCKFTQSEEDVEMFSLDDFAKIHHIDEIAFIWADLQSQEADMIRGGQATLAKTKYLYTEYSDSDLYEGQVPLDQLMALLPGSWSIVDKWPNDVLFINEDYLILDNANFH